MCGVFDQHAVVCGYLAAGLGLNQPFGGFNHAQVGINAAALVKTAQAVAGARQQRREVVACGCQHPGARLPKPNRAFCIRPGMPVQATYALEQHVHGA